ncbi:P-loop containing nucleoside triphosphate hydrolase protein [Elaphomyces granulatus]
MQDADPPVVVAAQTNHALDQLLNRISQFEENYIRLGRRSTDTNIKKKTLFEFRQKVRLADLPSGLLVAAKKELHSITEEVSRLLRPFNAENSDTPLPASFFLANDLISSAQYAKLRKGAEGWICSGSADKEDPMAIWLGDSVVEFKIDYKEENLGLAKEVDLDDIPEKEPETDVVFGDEESEALRGTLISIKEGLVGRGGLAALERVTKENFVKLQDLWKVPPKFRGGVYNALRKHAIDKVIAKLRKLIVRYNEACLKHKAGKWEIDYVYLKRAKVIGMTTTGLSKYRGLIACLRPKVIMIEEAAEVIEAPIAAACVESLEHLILVGDHKQLQGRCAVRALEGEPFFLNISMFERLAHNGMEFKTLTVQRRMAPEISALLTPIYGQLEDHPCVKEWPEESDDQLSKFNEYEAQMVVRFILYLVLNGILVSDITVLTFYNGQRKRLLSLLSRLKYLRDQVFKVATVDSYQGEENDVVILSLVRSNEKIGFLSDEHRVCVALSRAKRGFYIFGNGQSLALDPLWWDVIKTMGDGGERPRRLGFKLPLTCEKHGKMTFIHDLAQWDTINGGCDRLCGEVLSCGHECSLRCHSFPHDQVICNKTCNKRLPCGHICRGPCSKDRPCSCPCGVVVVVEEIEEKVDVWEGSNNEVISIVPSSSEDPVISNEKDHAEFIKNYRDFANGGAKKQDAVLNERAKAMASEEMQKILDEEAFNDLFGSNTREKKKAPNRMTPAVKRVGIDGTKRERYVDYFNADATPSKARKHISSGGNLLDTE